MSIASKSANPFPGLRAFRQDEDYLFFGREEQTIELVRRLGGNRFVTVVGTSGSGKSSLVRCGLLSELLGGKMLRAGASWEVAVTHPGGNPLAILTDALLEAGLYDGAAENARENLLATLSRSHLGLVEAVRQSGTSKETNFLLVVDQFEEIFRFREAGQTQQEAAAEFVSLLLESVTQIEVPIYVVLTMRSDFIGECSQFEGLSEMVNRGEFLIPRLTREQYKRVIEGPVKVAGGRISPRLLQRLLNDLGQQPDQLPCLQHALMRTWDVWAEAGETEALDLEDYRRVGGMAEALSLHADEVYNALGSDRERLWCRGLFEALTVKESENRGIRRPQRLSSLCEIIEVTPAQLAPIIDAFRRQGVTFLMPSPEVDLTDSTIIDISHESLMRVWTRLRQWVEEEAQAAGIYVRLAESAALHAQGKAGLYRDPELGIALSWIDRARHPNRAWAERYRHGYAEAMAFLAASKEAAEAGEREKEAARQREVAQAQALAKAERLRAEEQKEGARRLRKLLAAAAVIALVAVGASIFAAIQTGKARKSEAATDALASQLKTSLVQGDFNNSFEKLNSGDAGASLAYLARAMRTNPAYAPAGMRAISTLTSGRLPVQRFAPIEHAKPISNHLFNKKHDLLLTSSEEGREVHLWEMEAGRRRTPLEGASIEELRSRAAGPAPAAILAGIKDKFANSRRIWLASDPGEPPTDARYFRKAIPIPAGRKPARADLFLMVDNSFELSVNGINAGAGNDWQGTFHTGLLGPALEDGLDLSIVARNAEKGAYVNAVVIITFEEGDPLVVTSDARWQSSTAEATGFADSKDWGTAKDGGARIEELSAPALDQLQWSADEDRLVGREAGTGQIVEWDVATGKRTGKPVKLKGMKDLQISSFGEPGDLVGCSYTGDGAVQVWNLKTGEAATPRLKTGGNVIQWKFSPDGKRVIGLFSDAVIVVWDVIGGAEVARVRTRPVRPVGILLSGDGRFLLTWDESNKKVAWWEPGAAGGSGDLTWIDLPFASDDDRFLTSDNVVSFIGTGENKTVRARSYALTGDRKQVADITSGPNAVRMGGPGFRNEARNEPHGIVGAVTANAVNLWDLRTGEAFPRPLIAPELLASANPSPDGRRLIAGSATEGTNTAAAAADKKLFVFDVFNANLAFPRPIVLQSSSRIQFSPDGETLITMDPQAKRTSFWELRTGREVRAPIPVAANGGGFSRSGKRVALYDYASVRRGTQDLGQTTGRFFLHEVGLSSAASEYVVERSQRFPFVFAPSAGGQWLTYDWPAASPLARLQVWDAQNAAAERTLDLDVDKKASNWLGSCSLSGDGKRMILINREKSAVVLETATGKILAELSCEATVHVVAMSRDGSTAVCGTADGSVKLWTADRGMVSFKPFADQDSIDNLGLNGAGLLLAVSNATKRTIAVLDTRTGAPVFESRKTVNISEDFAFTPDGSYIIVSQLDAKIPMIDLKTGEVVREFEIADWSRGIDLNADGSLLAVGAGANLTARSGVAYLFDLASGRMLTPPLPHAGSVNRVQFSPDGAILATGTFETPGGFSYFQLWDVATGLPLNDPVAERGQVISIALQPDGSAAAASWSGGAAQTVAIPPKKAAPSWLPQLAEAVAGRRLDAETGTLENAPDEELAAIREKVLAADSTFAADGEWFKWVKWLFETPETRTVSPGAKTTMARRIEGLRASNNIDDLHQAVRLSPDDALLFARMATHYATSIPADIGTAKRHWEDTAVWYSDRATRLAPENADVWTMRGDLMRKLGRTAPAAEAAAKVLALAPSAKEASSPNTLYQNAMAFAAQGKWEEAQTAYDGALDRLDAYAKQIESGERPLPLLGNLGRLVPTRVAATKPDQPGDASVSTNGISNDPIPGAFENFDEVAPGGLPPGWRVWNRSDPGTRPGVYHAADFQADNWNDWTVIDRKQLEWGDYYLRRRILEERTESGGFADSAKTRLMDGRFAVAVSSSRPGEQIQYLESPDFDCTGRSGVHLAFNSAWEQHEERMGVIEYSLDRGTTWRPVVYYVHKSFLDEAKKQYADARKGTDTKGEFDVAAFLKEERSRFPWRPEAGATARRGNFGAFTVAADTPGLAACFEGRSSGYTEFKRREVRPLPDADGAATVRLRFGSVSSSHSVWAIDNVGLYEGAKPATPGDGVAVAAREIKRPANEPVEILKLAVEFGSGAKPAEGETLNSAPLVAAAMASVTAGPENRNVVARNPNRPTTPDVNSFPESRLLVARARKLDPANRVTRILSAVMELTSMAGITDKEQALKEAEPVVGRALELLLKSDDPAGDVRDPGWRAAFAVISAIRGMSAAMRGEREDGVTLLVLGEFVGTGTPAAAMARQMLAALEKGTEVTLPESPPEDSQVLLKRGSAWSYFDEGKLPGPGWTDPEFDDRLWFRGPAILGYGDTPKTSVGWGPDARRRFITTYFRTRFEVADPVGVKPLVLRLLRDDGAVVYLNGSEVRRDNMPKGTVNYETLADETVGDADEKRYFDQTIEGVSLRKGTNVVAVEVHQNQASSSDLAFDLEIAAVAGSAQLAGAAIPATTFAENFKAFGIPDLIQVEFWYRRAEEFLKSGDPVKAAEALRLTEIPGAHDESDPRRPRLQALIAAAGGNTGEADRLYAAAMDGMLRKSADVKSLPLGTLPAALREAALVLRRTPADLAFVFRRIAGEEFTGPEPELALNWARSKAGKDPGALAQVWHGLTDGVRRPENALAIAESVIASLPKPKAGSPADDRQFKDWLRRKERNLRAMGNKSAADALVAEIDVVPLRDPALSPKLLDLSRYYNASLRGWANAAVSMSQLPESFAPLKGVGFDLRGVIQLGRTPSTNEKPFNDKNGTPYPPEMTGIAVGQKSSAIHFLTSSSFGDTQGVEVARFTLHYDDDTSETMTVKSVDDVSDHNRNSANARPVPAEKVGWRGTNDDGVRLEMSELVWKNPHPDKTIKTIDFISAMSRAGPFLIAITLE